MGSTGGSDGGTVDPASSPVSGGVDIRTTRAAEILGYLKEYAFSLKHQESIRRLKMDPEDFIQDVMVNIFRREGLNHYDASKVQSGELRSLVFGIAKRHLIDVNRFWMEEKKTRDASGRGMLRSRIHLADSLDQPISTRDGDSEATLGDFLSAEPDMALMILEISEFVPEDQISPNYPLSWRGLFLLSVKDSPREIARSVGISTSRVEQLIHVVFDQYVRPVIAAG